MSREGAQTRSGLPGSGPRAVLLAAGGSRRLGRPKQLVRIGGESLVARALRRLLEAGSSAPTVVLGCEPERVAAGLAGLDHEAVVNRAWSRGIGASIACGVAAASQRPGKGYLIALADQVAVPSAHYRTLVALAVGAPGIVATRHGATVGVPAVFSEAFRTDLEALDGDRGAKGLIATNLGRVLTVRCEAAAEDVDLPADAARWEDAERCA